MSYGPKVRIAQNPLAVIAGLIGIIEVAFAYPVTHLSGSNQTILVAFMVVFPTLLMGCFFYTVWFRPGHLYGPKDYSKDDNFLKGIGKVIAAPSKKELIAQQTATDDSRPEEAMM